MLLKNFAKSLIPSLLISSSFSSHAAQPSSVESTHIFSNWTMYPDSGDCGGYTVTLIRDIKMQVVRGYLQKYVGNCEDSKTPITHIQLDNKSGKFSFSAADYVQDGKGGLKISAELRFTGNIKKKSLTGKFDYCPVDSKTCNSSDPVVLPVEKQGTP